MKISAEDQRKYPKFTRYVKNTLPKVKSVPKITKALLKYGEIKRRSLNTIFMWGTNPVVKVVAMNDACGKFTPNMKSNDLRISKSLVEKYEKNHRNKKVTLLLGATILHELAHWGDDQDGNDIAGEEGELFEKSAYGHVIPCEI